jgi:hypothetical protein
VCFFRLPARGQLCVCETVWCGRRDKYELSGVFVPDTYLLASLGVDGANVPFGASIIVSSN